MYRLPVFLLLVCAFAGSGIAQTSSANGLVVYETLGFTSGGNTAQAAVLSASMTTDTVLPVSVNASLSTDVGIAIANPASTIANLTMTLRASDGSAVSVKSLAVGAQQQLAEFISQLFTDVPALADFGGSLNITSDNAVAIIGLRFTGTAFSTIPITSFSSVLPVPQVGANVGGSGAIILPQFAAGGNWSSQIVILNTTAAALAVRLDLFGQDGAPLEASFGNQTGSSFQNIAIPAFGTLSDSAGATGPLQVGYLIVTSLGTVTGAVSAPMVTATTPLATATGVALNTTMSATFNETMNSATITTATFTLQQGLTNVAGTITYGGTTATFSPVSSLVPGTVYTATITTGAVSQSGNQLSNAVGWSFTTAGEMQGAPPTVTSISPANLATNVSLNVTPAVSFSEAINPLTATSAQFTLTGPGATPVPGSVSYDPVKQVLTFIPAVNLAASSTFTAVVSTGVMGLNGDGLANDTVWSFSTGPAQISLLTSLGLVGSFPTSQSVYADAGHIYLCSYEGNLFVLERNRNTNFPLIQTISIGSPLTAVRGDANNIYVTSSNGWLYVYAKTSPLQLVQSTQLSTYGLSALSLAGGNIYVAKGQGAMTATDSRLYLSELNPGDFVLNVNNMNSYGALDFVAGATLLFDSQTLQPIGALPNPMPGGVNINTWGPSVFLTVPGCCGQGIQVYDAVSLSAVQFLNRPTNVVAGIQSNGPPLLVGGSESGNVDLYTLLSGGYQLTNSLSLPALTGFNGPEDIEIRALWLDGIDDLVFAASSGGNTQSRAAGGLPTVFVLEIH